MNLVVVHLVLSCSDPEEVHKRVDEIAKAALPDLYLGSSYTAITEGN